MTNTESTDAACGAHQRKNKTTPTIYDVAKAADVSPSTVSRALHNPGRLSKKTEKRIKAAAAELGYRSNPMARALPTGRTHTIGLILSDITNPVFFDFVRGAESVAAEAEYLMILSETQEDVTVELDQSQRLMPSVDGLILLASRIEDDDIRALAADKPLVVVNRVVDDVTSLIPDLSEAVSKTLSYLKNKGHQYVAYLSGPSDSWMSDHRWNLLMQSAVSIGMSIVEIGPTEPTVDGGREMKDRILASGVTAIIAYNDLMATGLVKVLENSGNTVPDSISVIGFDDIFSSSLITPALSTVRTPLRKLGEYAVRELLTLIEGEPDGETEALHSTFVERDSSGLAP